MFRDSKYTKWYFQIVTKPDTNATYIEDHHIVPRSLGGSNAKSNRVKLSARQHFVAHLLLTKMVSGQARHKMIWALHRMTFSNGLTHQRNFKSSEYEMARRIFKLHASSSQKGRVFTEETLAKMRESSRKRWDRVAAGLEQHKTTKGYKYKQKKKRKQTGSLSIETRAKMAAVKWMCHPTHPACRVAPEFTDSYLASGWKFGRVWKVQ